MKRWFRPVAYSLILVLLALAIFGGRAPADTALVSPVTARRHQRPPQPVADDGLAELRSRRRDTLPLQLFAVAPTPPPVAPVTAPPAPVAPAIPDLKVLGWMQAEAGPFVFVELNSETHTLKPTEAAADVYRFDRIEAGFAAFTYLPTGEARRYPVSDPAPLE